MPQWMEFEFNYQKIGESWHRLPGPNRLVKEGESMTPTVKPVVGGEFSKWKVPVVVYVDRNSAADEVKEADTEFKKHYPDGDIFGT